MDILLSKHGYSPFQNLLFQNNESIISAQTYIGTVLRGNVPSVQTVSKKSLPGHHRSRLILSALEQGNLCLT